MEIYKTAVLGAGITPFTNIFFYVISMMMSFSSMVYTPDVVYLGKYTGEQLAFVLTKQLVWIILLYLLGTYLWSRITKRLIGLCGFFFTQITGIAFLYLVFEQIPVLADWNLEQLIFIYGFAQIPRGLDHLFTDNIWLVAWRLVVNGKFDRYMLRPMNLFWQVIFEKLQPHDLGELLVGTILIVSSLMKGVIIVDALYVLFFVISVIAGTVIYTAEKLLFASLAFWIKISGPVLYTAYQLADFAKYPTEIYEKGVRFIITWVIPFAFVAYLPTSYFLKPEVHPGATVGVECLIAVVLFAVAYLVFTIGTSAYESAGK